MNELRELGPFDAYRALAPDAGEAAPAGEATPARAATPAASEAEAS